MDGARVQVLLHHAKWPDDAPLETAVRLRKGVGHQMSDMLAQIATIPILLQYLTQAELGGRHYGKVAGSLNAHLDLVVALVEG